MMLEWLVAIAVLVLALALLPALLRRGKAGLSKRGGSGVWVGIGLGVAMIFDPKVAEATEIVESKKDETEEDDSGDEP